MCPFGATHALKPTATTIPKTSRFIWPNEPVEKADQAAAARIYILQ
jgi:hypothetical protein